MNASSSGLPSLTALLIFIAVNTLPIWFAAHMVGARAPTFLRSAAALVIGVVCAAVVSAFAGPSALFLVPVAILLCFKLVLDTSFMGAVALAVVAIAGYVAMAHLLGGGRMT